MHESADLFFWQTINLTTNTLSAMSNGDGTETVTVRGNLPLTGAGAVPRVFLRLDVAPAP